MVRGDRRYRCDDGRRGALGLADTGALLTALLLGLRHGFDPDHLAAIADVTAAAEDRARALVGASLYALGHAAMVSVLGALALLLGRRIPAGFDRAMEMVVGVTLVALGAYVVWMLVRRRDDVHFADRWTLLLRLLRRLAPHRSSSVHHAHPYVSGRHGDPPDEPRRSRSSPPLVHAHRLGVVGPAPRSSALAPLSIGVLHGIGAETPTQLLLFVTAAGAGGRALGAAVVAAFVLGLLVSNTLVALASAYAFTVGAAARLKLPLGLAVAGSSIWLGLTYLF